MGYYRAKRVVGTAGTFQVGSSEEGACLEAIVVNNFETGGVCTVYNGQDATGEVVATIDCSTIAAQGTYRYGALLDAGIYVAVTGGAAEVTVVYY